MTDPNRDQSIGILKWLVESGADEATSETALNRFETPDLAVRTTDQHPAANPPIPHRDQSPANRTAGASSRSEINKTAAAVSLSSAPGAARALAASCTTLAELKNAVVNFDGCELKRYATNTVFADGTPAGRIMLIGEAPGRDEDLQGLPFVGRAGKLLDRMLAAIGLDRGKVYITNVLNWRPPQNREPSPEEAAACLPFLHRHIELADPQILILLGAVSVRYVLGLNEGIMRLRGKWETYQNGPQPCAIPVMPTLHPAYLLRQPAGKRLAWRDFLAVSEKVEQLGLA